MKIHGKLLDALKNTIGESIISWTWIITCDHGLKKIFWTTCWTIVKKSNFAWGHLLWK